MLDVFVLGKLEVLQHFFSGRPVKCCELIQFMLRRSWFDGFHWAA